MKISIYNKYKEDFLPVTDNLFKRIDNIEKEIKNINFKSSFSLDKSDLALWKLKNEIIQYFQYNNGALGYDIFLIKYILRQLLIYTFIVKEKDISKNEKNTCRLEIEVRFYLFLNCIYNFKEKLEKFFKISVKRNKISFKDTILSDDGKKNAELLFNKYFVKIKDYCNARGCLVHDIYEINYEITKNEIVVCTSNFNLSTENVTRGRKKSYYFDLNAQELISLVEELQMIRKKAIEFTLDINNFVLKELISKFSTGKGIFKF